jgi:hypothetical protein
MIEHVKTFIEDHSAQLLKGSVGMSATLGSVGVSTIQEVELWLRISSLCVGILVGLLTAWSIFKKNKDKQ